MVCPHHFRHSYASSLVSRGVSLHIVGRLLGHTQPQTTARYAHLDDEALREATNGFGRMLEGVIQDGGAEVVELAGRSAGSKPGRRRGGEQDN